MTKEEFSEGLPGMESMPLPLVKVRSVRSARGVVRTKIRVLSSPEYFTSSVSPATIMRGEEPGSESFELHRLISRFWRYMVFETYGDALPLAQPGETYIFTSWWTDDQLEIAQGGVEGWEQREFVPSDAVRFPAQQLRELVKEETAVMPDLFTSGSVTRKRVGNEMPEGGTTIPGGWDHEHCALCWKTIGLYDDEERNGYIRDDKWLCVECYDKFLVSGVGRQLGDRSGRPR